MIVLGDLKGGVDNWSRRNNNSFFVVSENKNRRRVIVFCQNRGTNITFFADKSMHKYRRVGNGISDHQYVVATNLI